MQSKATTVAQYLKELPADRRALVAAVRKVVLENLDDDFEEGMGYGMISWHVPHRVFPAGYHCNPKLPLPFAALASQKNYLSLYLLSVYAEPQEEAWLRKQFEQAAKSLDMGKCCIRFKTLDDLPLDVIGQAIARVSVKAHVAHYERSLLTMNKAAAQRRAAKPAPRAKA
ncbi:MAG: DUF1801 domain-containing protein [Planctomycetota bacterium]